MPVQVAAGTQYTYRANEHDTVLSEVSAVHCVLLPRAILVNGFNEAGKLVMAHYNSYAANEPTWNTEFFNHDFINEKLLGVPQQVKAIFIASDAELIIPNELFDEKGAKSWMNALQTICPDDVIHTHPLTATAAQYSFALPARMDKLLHRYFGQTRILPVAAYQFFKPDTGAKYLLQCMISQDTVIASLHNSGKLLWHRQFPYITVEDIVWQVASLCRDMQIPHIDLQLDCAMLCEGCYDLALELERFFAKIKWSAGAVQQNDKWSPMIYLAQQLYACAL